MELVHGARDHCFAHLLNPPNSPRRGRHYPYFAGEETDSKKLLEFILLTNSRASLQAQNAHPQGGTPCTRLRLPPSGQL